MTTKKLTPKRGRSGASKRSGSKKKATTRSATKKSVLQATFKKAAPRTVVFRPNAKTSDYADRALSAFSAGVQRALEQLARRNLPAVVVENGRRVTAVPVKVGGRYVVREAGVSGNEARSVVVRKRGPSAG